METEQEKDVRPEDIARWKISEQDLRVVSCISTFYYQLVRMLYCFLNLSNLSWWRSYSGSCLDYVRSTLACLYPSKKLTGSSTGTLRGVPRQSQARLGLTQYRYYPVHIARGCGVGMASSNNKK